MNRRQRNINITLHILAWLLVFFLPDLLFDMPNSLISEAKRNMHFILAFLFFYLNYFLVVPALLLRKKQLWFALILVFSLFFTYYVSDFTMKKVRKDNTSYFTNKTEQTSGRHTYKEKKEKWLERHRMSENVGTAIIVLISFLLSTIARETMEWYKNDEEKKGMEKEKLISELSLLKSQVNPHFLFNSLNGIYALAIKKSDKTPDALVQLSEMLRHMLYDAEKEHIELNKEITYLKNYISLQKLRLPSDATVSFEIEGDTQEIVIAPLLFIPFVENAFKHGTGTDNPLINVRLKVDNGKIFFSVVNKVSDAGNKDESSGIGLANVRKRLSLLYADNYRLDIKTGKGMFKVFLEINLNRR